MTIEHDMTVSELLMRIDTGERYFHRIDFGEDDVEDKNLDNIVFDECIMSMRN